MKKGSLQYLDGHISHVLSAAIGNVQVDVEKVHNPHLT